MESKGFRRWHIYKTLPLPQNYNSYTSGHYEACLELAERRNFQLDVTLLACKALANYREVFEVLESSSPRMVACIIPGVISSAHKILIE